MNQLRFLIVEENPSSASNLMQQIKKIGYLPIKIVHTVETALQYISKETVDAVISNIFFNGKTEGFQLATKLNEVNIPIYFITDSEDLILYKEAQQYRPAGYLVNPSQTINLLSIIESSLQHSSTSSRKERHNESLVLNAFFVKQNNLLRKVPINEVLWIKTEGNYSLIHTTTKKYIIKLSLKKVLDQLPKDFFIQIQRAYIVALPKIEDIDISTNHVLINKERIPLGRNFREELFSRLKILK